MAHGYSMNATVMTHRSHDSTSRGTRGMDNNSFPTYRQCDEHATERQRPGPSCRGAAGGVVMLLCAPKFSAYMERLETSWTRISPGGAKTMSLFFTIPYHTIV